MCKGVRKNDTSNGCEWEEEDWKGRQSEGRMTIEGAKVCDVGRVVLGTIVLGHLVLGQFVQGQFVLGQFVLGQFFLGKFVLTAETRWLTPCNFAVIYSRRDPFANPL